MLVRWGAHRHRRDITGTTCVRECSAARPVRDCSAARPNRNYKVMKAWWPVRAQSRGKRNVTAQDSLTTLPRTCDACNEIAIVQRTHRTLPMGYCLDSLWGVSPGVGAVPAMRGSSNLRMVRSTAALETDGQRYCFCKRDSHERLSGGVKGLSTTSHDPEVLMYGFSSENPLHGRKEVQLSLVSPFRNELGTDLRLYRSSSLHVQYNRIDTDKSSHARGSRCARSVLVHKRDSSPERAYSVSRCPSNTVC